MRARLHLRGMRSGFFREGTHALCDARATRQLLPASCDAVDVLVDRLRLGGWNGDAEIEVSENIDASDRAIHLESLEAPAPNEGLIGPLPPGVTGVSASDPRGKVIVVGTPVVSDTLSMGDCTFTLQRHVLAFFQGNRHLFRDLVDHVAGLVPERGALVDLYAGVGGFAIAAAVTRAARVTAVEGDAVAARDLDANIALAGGAIECLHQSVETFTAKDRPCPDAVILDPPRTGLSNAALAAAVGLRARQVIYVSCDVATLARDARKLVDAGYGIRRVDAFDLFPNTPHVETVVEFLKDVGM
jgi:23S rRNA (uracil1939-C5)-methyltransferase